MKTSTSSSCYASSRVPSARLSRPVTVRRRHPHELVQTRVPLALAPAPDEPARRHPEPEVVQTSPRRRRPSVNIQPARRFVFPRRPRHPTELLRGTPTDGGGAVGREERAAAPTLVETGSRVEKRPVAASRATGRHGRSGIRRARHRRRRRRRRRSSKVPPRRTVVVAVAASSRRRDRAGHRAGSETRGGAKTAREETGIVGIVEDVEVVAVETYRG